MKKYREFVCLSGSCGKLHTELFRIRLVPHVKKYPCLWYKSRKNHYILCFVVVPGTRFPNKGKCLWKAQNALARCGVPAANLPQVRCNPWASVGILPNLKPSPRRGREQGAEAVHLGRESVQMWTIGPVIRSARFWGVIGHGAARRIVLAVNAQSGSWLEPSADAGRERCGFPLASIGRTQRVYLVRAGAVPR